LLRGDNPQHSPYDHIQFGVVPARVADMGRTAPLNAAVEMGAETCGLKRFFEEIRTIGRALQAPPTR
jgi:hypothetical protein